MIVPFLIPAFTSVSLSASAFPGLKLFLTIENSASPISSLSFIEYDIPQPSTLTAAYSPVESLTKESP